MSERQNRLKYKYGISEEDYQRMLLDQGGVCAVCGKGEARVFNGKLCPLSVDHCHRSGKVRGLLCSHCNVGIGNLKDDPDLLRKAAQYLKESKRGDGS